MDSEKTRYFIFISFKGTSYHGWQVQSNALTVQHILEDSLSTILNEEISTTGAGRTDSGVHAPVFCAHFDCSSPDLSLKNDIISRLNKFLPKDISVFRILKVLPEAHARFSAISRTYSYYIIKFKDPFQDGFSWFIQRELDLNAMNRASGLLLKFSDFTSFCKLHSDTKTNICNVTRAHWEEKNGTLVFTVQADRFLRNMVRAIVGTLVEVGKGKISHKEFEEIIVAKDRCRAGRSAPAQGLFLTDIEYPEEIFIL